MTVSDIPKLWARLAVPVRAEQATSYFSAQTVEMARAISEVLSREGVSVSPGRIISESIDWFCGNVDCPVGHVLDTIEELNAHPKSKVAYRVSPAHQDYRDYVNEDASLSEFVRAAAHIVVKQVYDEYVSGN